MLGEGPASQEPRGLAPVRTVLDNGVVILATSSSVGVTP